MFDPKRLPLAALVAVCLLLPLKAFTSLPSSCSSFSTQTIHSDGTGGNWGLDRIDQASGTDGFYHYRGTGSGVNVYIIDTGVNTAHSDFLDSSGRRRIQYVGDFCQGQVRTNSPETYDDGYDGHGTHNASYAAGTLSGVAKNATIWSLRAQGSDGPACGDGKDAGAMKAAVDWINANATAPAVVNISLALRADGCDDERGGDGVCVSALLSSIRTSIGKGFIYTLSGGTHGSVGSHWGTWIPSHALVIGGTNQSDNALNANADYGALLALFAPAARLYGAGRGSNTALTIPEGATGLGSGDSFAAPFVAGAAAVYLETHRSASPDDVRSALTTGATPGVVGNAGSAPNRLLRIQVQ